LSMFFHINRKCGLKIEEIFYLPNNCEFVFYSNSKLYKISNFYPHFKFK